MKKRVDKAFLERMRGIMAKEGLGWEEFRRRYFKCPWCVKFMWKIIRQGDNSVVMCVNCKMPYMSQQVVTFWEKEIVRKKVKDEASRAKWLDELEKELKKEQAQDKSKDSRLLGFTKNGLPYYRFKDDSPSD